MHRMDSALLPAGQGGHRDVFWLVFVTHRFLYIAGVELDVRATSR